jgi:hypothetical protein
MNDHLLLGLALVALGVASLATGVPWLATGAFVAAIPFVAVGLLTNERVLALAQRPRSGRL